MMNIPPHALQAFRLIAQHQSFTHAAAALEISPSALSQTLRQLEQQLAVRLLNRTTRRVSLTEAGQMLLERITPALVEIGKALEALRQQAGQPAGCLRLTLPHTVAQLVINQSIAGFLRAYPAITLDLDINNSLVDIVACGMDGGIRFGESLHQNMQAVAISPPLSFVIVAASSYLAQQAPIQAPPDLAQHACLRLRFSHNGSIYRWQLYQQGRSLDIAVQGPLTANDNRTLLHAAVGGAGIAYLPQAMAQPYLDDGSLVSLLTDWLPPAEALYLYYPHYQHQTPKLRAFIDYLRQQNGLV